ncbi:hypothetical protein AVEN_159903-1 [Araneus ventricosus]|uniref:Uncharacterized protein n=1 Tax=Araneus ventricosus TaxID=182803 RepID=A0A4Y2E4K2_ARAVE|nr:hypothetical protein AVEN_159903-1 [Araneus ventricosus]
MYGPANTPYFSFALDKPGNWSQRYLKHSSSFGFEENRNEESSLNGRRERSHEVMGFAEPRRGPNECSDGEIDYPYFDRNNKRNVSY